MEGVPLNVKRALIEFDALLPRVTRDPAREFSPHTPHAKQREFMALDCREALYGGAAGGGKSDGILADVLQYVHESSFSALLLRRTLRDLALPGAIMDRAHAWLRGTRAHWNGNEYRYRFPSGASLQFGYCRTRVDCDNYKSTEFHYVGVDELTEWPEDFYLYFFSRQRRHMGSKLPVKTRSGTNPDGLYNEWVRERFGIPENAIVTANIQSAPDRWFIPARAEDNPTIDLVDYDASLQKLGPIKYDQLRWGRWLRDGEGLVYSGFNPSKNVIDEAPTCTRFVLAIDYGFTDATAFVVLGWRENDPNVYVLWSRKAEGLYPSQAAELTREMETKWKFEAIVGDIGGLGKGYAEEGRMRFALPIEPAQKNNKRGYQDLINGAFALGNLLITAGNDDLVAELNRLPWKTGRREESPGFDNHLCDALLYGWRRCRAFYESVPAAQPEAGTPAAYQAAAEKAKRLHLASVKQKNETPYWKRGR